MLANPIVLSASTNVAEQLMVNAINQTLGNYFLPFWRVPIIMVAKEMINVWSIIGRVECRLCWCIDCMGANPVYTNGKAKPLLAAISKAKTKIAL